jgi:uncharacterized membrane protein YphA (DoxX/SURF4 family)
MTVAVAFLYARLALGFLFLVAGLSKAWDRRAFQLAVASFQIVPVRLAPPVATLIVAMELAGSGVRLCSVVFWSRSLSPSS